MVDVADLGGIPQASDFILRVGTDGDPADWQPYAGDVQVSLRPGAGEAESYRIALIFPASSIVNQWLEVTVLADGNGGSLGLSANDVFYFGNLAGDVNGDAVVDGDDRTEIESHLGDGLFTGDANGDHQADGNDLIAVEENFGNVGPTNQPGDANHDGQVDGNDLIAVEERFGQSNDPVTVGDVNLDGVVNQADVDLANANTGATLVMPDTGMDPDVNLADQLLANWSGDGSAGDASVNGNDLQIHGSVTYASGLLGDAFQLDGTGDTYLSLGTGTEAFDFGESDFTIQAWVNHNTLAGEQIIVEKFSGQTGPGWTFTKLASDPTSLHFYTQQGSTSTSPAAMIAGTWHHMLLRRSGSNLAFYVDGELLQETSVLSGAISASTNDLLIGRRHAGDPSGPMAFNGLIDDMAVWTRALNDTEIGYLYNGGTGRAVSGAIGA